MSDDRVAVQDGQPLEQITVPVHVFQNIAKLSDQALRVYLALTWLTRTSDGFTSLRDIGAVAGIDTGEVDDAIDELQEIGLAKKRTGTPGIGTTYFLVKPGV